nr:methyltransferase [Dechloromonas sp.]
MKLCERQAALDSLLLAFREFWHPQPFREIRPDWCVKFEALSATLLNLDDATATRLNDQGDAALGLFAKHVPAVADLLALAELPLRQMSPLADHGSRWAWEIPGRKRAQIEAFAAATRSTGQPVLDWCGGKGHLGRLLAHEWRIPVETLEIDPALCAAGAALAAKGGVDHEFRATDVMTVDDRPLAGQHAVALHACGDLHRQLLRRGSAAGARRLDVAPCCYHRGGAEVYCAMSPGLALQLSRDDMRLAVTETVTASAREGRQRDRGMAWKLGWDAYRRAVTNDEGYRNFKPVSEALLRGSFADFLAAMVRRERVPGGGAANVAEFEVEGWRRQREVFRLSIVRHAFRRALEVWLVLDLAVYLEAQGYAVELGRFCERYLSPRNLLISAVRA